MKNILNIAIVVTCILQCAQSASLRFYNGSSSDQYVVAPLDNPVPILCSLLNSTRETVFYTFGYNGSADGPTTLTVVRAYLSVNIYNLLVLDWRKEASAISIPFIGYPIGYVVNGMVNTVVVGNQLGEGILKLVAANCTNVSKVHLVGHSLGAHVMGNAGKACKEHGHTLARITGLDPAGIGYSSILSIPGLSSDDAEYVDVTHTDNAFYGTNRSLGQADFWPNYGLFAGYGDNVQPGCPPQTSIVQRDMCSHNRAVAYHVESITTPCSFISSRAADYPAWRASNGTGERACMGQSNNSSAHGNYYLTTNAAPQYGKGELGLTPES